MIWADACSSARAAQTLNADTGHRSRTLPTGEQNTQARAGAAVFIEGLRSHASRNATGRQSAWEARSQTAVAIGLAIGHRSRDLPSANRQHGHRARMAAIAEDIRGHLAEDMPRLDSVGGERYRRAVDVNAVAGHLSGSGLTVYGGVCARSENAADIWGTGGPEGVAAPLPEKVCYVPPAHFALNFVLETGGSTNFTLTCQDVYPIPVTETITVPRLRVYIVPNSISVTSGGQELHAANLSIRTDADSWAWSMSLTIPRYHEARLSDTVNVTINGQSWVFSVEDVSRERVFPTGAINVTGRSQSAELAAPYAIPEFRQNSQLRTAQQIIADILTINGVSLGYALDWGLDDWTVPANQWQHEGTYIESVLDIAAAAGAIVQSHQTDKTLRFLPRYPVAPWDWATPDISLPSSVVTRESAQRIIRPDYNRLFAIGAPGAGGIIANVSRSGTAGDKEAPQIIHRAITHQDAGRQLGLSVLGNTGTQEQIQISTPIDPADNLDLLGINDLAEVTEGQTSWLGLVRGVEIRPQWPSVRQILTMERHL